MPVRLFLTDSNGTWESVDVDVNGTVTATWHFCYTVSKTISQRKLTLPPDCCDSFGGIAGLTQTATVAIAYRVVYDCVLGTWAISWQQCIYSCCTPGTGPLSHNASLAPSTCATDSKSVVCTGACKSTYGFISPAKVISSGGCLDPVSITATVKDYDYLFDGRSSVAGSGCAGRTSNVGPQTDRTITVSE